MTPEQIAATALDAGEGVASILALVPDPAVRAGGTIAVGLIRAIRALTSSMGAEKAAAVIRAMADTSHAITPEDLAGDDATLAAKVRAAIAARDGDATRRTRRSSSPALAAAQDASASAVRAGLPLARVPLPRPIPREEPESEK